MPAQDQIRDLARRIAPHLQECCVEAFTMSAIITDADGNAARVSFGGAAKTADPAFLAMLTPIDRLGECWSKGEL